MSRDSALQLMYEWVKSESLRKHLYCVEAAMRAYARKFGEDEELWGICGLLHDFDYEKFPTYDATTQSGHPYEGINILRKRGYPKEIIEAILGHALYSGVPRASSMAKYLFACDELCGFIVACAYLKTDKFASLTAESISRRLKEKKFAAKVSREEIDQGITEIGTDRDTHIQFIIDILKPIQDQIFN